jgi:hypothetical protein
MRKRQLEKPDFEILEVWKFSEKKDPVTNHMIVSFFPIWHNKTYSEVWVWFGQKSKETALYWYVSNTF